MRSSGRGSRAGAGAGARCLTFAITPGLYVDDGEAGLRAAEAARAGRLASRRRGGVPLELGADEGEAQPGFWDGEDG